MKLDTQDLYVRGERDSIGAQIHGTCRAHARWDCDRCADRSGGEGHALYCAGYGAPVVTVTTMAQYDALVKPRRRIRGRVD